ncbi:zinc finger MYM-type protein 1-like protein [Tanacetum coccineum]
MAPIRKYPSGAEKRKKKKQEEASMGAQKGSMYNYVTVQGETQVPTHNPNVDDNNVDGDEFLGDDVNTNLGSGGVGDVNVDKDVTDDTNVETKSVGEANSDDDIDGTSVENVNVEGDQVDEPDVDIHHIDIFDPRRWDGLHSDQIKVLIAEGPKRDKSIDKGPKDKFSRRFFSSLYTRTLPNNEKCDREWLVYSKELDKVYCFCCKLLRKGLPKGQLAGEGFADWAHIGVRLKEHEVGLEHVTNMASLIEMLEEFDPIIKEHVRRITSDEVHVHYLGHSIQNELILLLARAIKLQIIKKIKQAKYFSMILDCTPDNSHQEQMSLILRYVNMSSTGVRVEESFLGFLNVDDTTGQGLFDVTHEELKSLDLDIDDVRGQGYDNGSNMKGKHRGVQKKFLDINPRAFYTPCRCHSLNLVLCDMANTCGKSMDFFGVIQRIYTIFANSSKRWQILKDNVKGLTLKSLSITRWESRVESVKAIRF